MKKGNLSNNWKGGLQKRHGRFYLTLPTGRIARYIHFMEVHLGRKLKSNEVVHHINGIKTDDRLENLEVMTRSDHNKYHQRLLGLKNKIQPKEVEKIRMLYLTGALNLRQLGNIYKRSISTIHNIVRRKISYK